MFSNFASHVLSGMESDSSPFVNLEKEPSMTATTVLKRELRTRIKNVLRTCPRHVIKEESARVCSMLMVDEVWKQAQTVALYASMDAEFDTCTLLQEAFVSGKRVFLPRVVDKKKRDMRMLETKHGEINSWTPNNWGIREPPLDGRADAPRDVQLDLVVVPGVAFTVDGKRCGHGAGFYDTFLNRCGSQTNTVALALGVQIIDEVPTGPWDVPIGKVIFSQPS